MRLSAVFLLAAVLLPAATAPAGDFVVGMPVLNRSGSKENRVTALLREAYARIGITARFRSLPMPREYAEVVGRDIDAGAGRTRLAAEGDPALVPVPFPLLRTTVVAYSITPRDDLHGWDDLLPYAMGYLRGDRTTGRGIATRHPAAREFTTLHAGFAALRAHRLDVFVTHTTFVELAGMSDRVRDLAVSAPLYAGYFHHYLNQGHGALAPRLSAALRAMLEDGTSARIMGRFRDLLPDPHPGAAGTDGVSSAGRPR